MLKKTNKNALKARKELVGRRNDISRTLEKYKSSKELCLYMFLIVVFVVLLGVFMRILRMKGYT